MDIELAAIVKSWLFIIQLYFAIEQTTTKWEFVSLGVKIRLIKINPNFKFTFSKKATKIDKIFTVDLTLCSNCQIDGEDFVNFCGLLRKHGL